MSWLRPKEIIVACVCVLLLGACRQEPDVPPSVAVRQPALEEGAVQLDGATASDKQSSGAGVSIAGIRLDLGFEHELIYDRVDEEGGIRQRKIFVEAVELPAADIETWVTQAMGAQGYALADRKAALGGHRLDFSKAGAARIVALVRPRLNAGDGPAAGIVQFTASERLMGEPGEQSPVGSAVVE